MSKSTKWPIVGSEYSKCGPGMGFWEVVEEHEMCDCLLKTSPARLSGSRPDPPGESSDALF
eukprot:5604530-Pyramimonas_sp.AAC.1